MHLMAPGAIGAKNLKRDDRGTSLHIYPNGVVKPTNEKWATLQITHATAEELREDAVWFAPDYCENYATGGSNVGESSENKHREGEGKGKPRAAKDALAQVVVVVVGNGITKCN
ncbi:hypothetical protein DL98DRAFT_598018 [Cadophora sp. DSE1049]|nr:hypothetical protein DL98DRAFT_598018 [Cadophora sp. DSE1049]